MRSGAGFGLSAHVLCAVLDRDALPAQPEQAVGRRNLFRPGGDPESFRWNKQSSRLLASAAAQFEQAVKDYFHSLSWSQPAPANAKPATAAQSGEPRVSIPFRCWTRARLAAASWILPTAQAQALVAEMMVRLPEHRDQGEKDLQAIIADPKTENAIAHRGLAWAHLRKKGIRSGE